MLNHLYNADWGGKSDVDLHQAGHCVPLCHDAVIAGLRYHVAAAAAWPLSA
jgi:hypothetical protein